MQQSDKQLDHTGGCTVPSMIVKKVQLYLKAENRQRTMPSSQLTETNLKRNEIMIIIDNNNTYLSFFLMCSIRGSHTM